jgi:hypothetical protein
LQEGRESVAPNPVEDLACAGARQALGQTMAGRHLRVIYVPYEEGDGILVFTAYPLTGRQLTPDC